MMILWVTLFDLSNVFGKTVNYETSSNIIKQIVGSEIIICINCLLLEFTLQFDLVSCITKLY